MSKDSPSRMVSIDLFTHPKMLGTSALAKCLFVYLLMPNPCGVNCISVRQMRMMVDASATDDDIRAALAELCEVGVVRWDPEHEVVWVVKALERQAKGASPKIGKCVANHLAILPRSPLIDAFKERYHEWLVRARVLEEPQQAVERSAPTLRVVDGEASGSERDTLSAYPIGIPYAISDTETDTVTESAPVVADHPGSSRQPRESERRAVDISNLTRTQLEDEIRRVLLEAKVVLEASESYLAPIVERLQAGDADLDDVYKILVEWKRRRTNGDKQQPANASHLFRVGRPWYATQIGYLGRTPPPKRKATSSSALPAAKDYWAKVTEAAPPDDDEPYTDEDAMRDYLAMTGMSAT